jgi:hypothetical protein
MGGSKLFALQAQWCCCSSATMCRIRVGKPLSSRASRVKAFVRGDGGDWGLLRRVM